MIRRVGAHPGAAELRRGRCRPEDAELGDDVTRCLLREEVRLLEVELAQAVHRHARAARHHDVRDHQAGIGQSGPGDDRAEAVGDHGQRLLGLQVPARRRTQSGRARPSPGRRCIRSIPPPRPGRRPGCRSPSTRRRRSRCSPRRGCAHRGSIPRTGSTRHRHRERTPRRARPSRDHRRGARSAAAAGGTPGCRPRDDRIVSSRVIRSSSSSSVAAARSIFAAARLLAARRDNSSFPRMGQVTPRPRALRACRAPVRVACRRRRSARKAQDPPGDDVPLHL